MPARTARVATAVVMVSCSREFRKAVEDRGDGALFLEEGVVAVARADADGSGARNGARQRLDVLGRHQPVAVDRDEGRGHGDRRRIDAVQVDRFRQAPEGGGAHAVRCAARPCGSR